MCIQSHRKRGYFLFSFLHTQKPASLLDSIHLQILCLHWLRAALALLTCFKENLRVWNVVSSISKIFLLLLEVVKIINKVKSLLTY